jgi:hypothetical protein
LEKLTDVKQLDSRRRLRRFHDVQQSFRMLGLVGSKSRSPGYFKLGLLLKVKVKVSQEALRLQE